MKLLWDGASPWRCHLGAVSSRIGVVLPPCCRDDDSLMRGPFSTGSVISSCRPDHDGLMCAFILRAYPGHRYRYRCGAFGTSLLDRLRHLLFKARKCTTCRHVRLLYLFLRYRVSVRLIIVTAIAISPLPSPLPLSCCQVGADKKEHDRRWEAHLESHKKVSARVQSGDS